jgi:uncharacterized protein
VIEAAPFLLLGVLVSQVLATAVGDARLLAWVPRGRLAGLGAGAGFGMLFPVCECGNVPVTRRLVARGVPVAVALVFFLAAPAFNPVVALSTLAAFRDQPAIVVFRLLFSFAIPVGVGLLVSLHPRPADLLQSRAAPAPSDSNAIPVSRVGRVQAFSAAVIQEFAEMGVLLVLGAGVAALTQALVPRSTLLALGQGPVLSVLAMMALAVVLSVCSTVDAFVALAYAGTVTDGALVAFLVFGPMIDIKSLLLMLTVFRARAVLLVSTLVTEAVFLVGLLLNYWGP